MKEKLSEELTVKSGSEKSHNYNRRAFVKRVVAAGAAAAVLPSVTQAGAPKENGDKGNPNRRRLKALDVRVKAAQFEADMPIPPHVDNGDDALYPNRIGSFTKGLPHNDLGEVDPKAYKIYLSVLASGEPEDFEKIPLGCAEPHYARLVNPQAGLAFDLEGADSHALAIPPAPTVGSAEETGEILELYWMSLTRDVAFRDYGSDPIAQAAAADLSRLSDFRGPKCGGMVTTDTLFRDPLPGALLGPYVSQFRWLPIPYGANSVDPQIETAVPGGDYLTDPAEWLNVQNGCPPSFSQQYDPTRRFIRNGRDAGQFVHVDVLHQAYYIAMLTLLALNCPLNPGNPYLSSKNQVGFGTFGAPHITTLMPEVGTRALHAVWFQKWFVHRRVRPEEYGGLIENNRVQNAPYPVWTTELSDSTVWGYLMQRYPGSYLLPQAFPEGCPLHPSYGAGHATVAGASVTILKAWFDGSQKLVDLLKPFNLQVVQATSDGLALEPYTGSDVGELTVEGELNKLASNIAAGRNMAGVHWRSDSIESYTLGEEVALRILQDQRDTYNENFTGFTFRKFDGTQITV